MELFPDPYERNVLTKPGLEDGFVQSAIQAGSTRNSGQCSVAAVLTVELLVVEPMMGLFQRRSNEEENSSSNSETAFYKAHILSHILNGIGEWPRDVLSNRSLILICPLISIPFTIVHLLLESLAQSQGGYNVASQSNHHHTQRKLGPDVVRDPRDCAKNSPIRANYGVAHLQTGFRELATPVLVFTGNLLESLLRRRVETICPRVSR